MIIKSYERTVTFVAAIHAQSCKGACHTLDFLDFILIPKKMVVLISLNRCGMVGVGLGDISKVGSAYSAYFFKDYIMIFCIFCIFYYIFCIFLLTYVII